MYYYVVMHDSARIRNCIGGKSVRTLHDHHIAHCNANTVNTRRSARQYKSIFDTSLLIVHQSPQHSGTMFATTSARSSVITRSSGGKVDIKKQGLNSIGNDVVRKNLMGVSEKMKDKNWVDSSGRKGVASALSVRSSMLRSESW